MIESPGRSREKGPMGRNDVPRAPLKPLSIKHCIARH